MNPIFYCDHLTIQMIHLLSSYHFTVGSVRQLYLLDSFTFQIFWPARPFDLLNHLAYLIIWPPWSFDLFNRLTSLTIWPARPFDLLDHLTCSIIWHAWSFALPDTWPETHLDKPDNLRCQKLDLRAYMGRNEQEGERPINWIQFLDFNMSSWPIN